MLKILIGCPVIDTKGDISKWFEAVKPLKQDFYMVDTSDTPDFSKKWGIHHLEGMKGLDTQERIRQGRMAVREKFLTGNYDWYLSLDSDNTCPPDIIEDFKKYTEFDIICYVCDTRTPAFGRNHEATMGCTFISRKVYENWDYGFSVKGIFTDTLFYRYVWKKGFKIISLYNVKEIGHNL
jgi:hypothetical protein